MRKKKPILSKRFEKDDNIKTIRILKKSPWRMEGIITMNIDLNKIKRKVNCPTLLDRIELEMENLTYQKDELNDFVLSIEIENNTINNKDIERIMKRQKKIREEVYES